MSGNAKLTAVMAALFAVVTLVIVALAAVSLVDAHGPLEKTAAVLIYASVWAACGREWLRDTRKALRR